MNVFLVRVNEPVGLTKVQIRDNVNKDKRELPKYDYTQMDITMPITSASYYPQRHDTFFREGGPSFQRVVFEVKVFITAVWNEVNRDGQNSYGYHTLIRDYVELPQGCSLESVTQMREGDNMDMILNVQYYRDEIDMLRDRIRHLENEIKVVKTVEGDDNSYLERMGIL